MRKSGQDIVIVSMAEFLFCVKFVILRWLMFVKEWGMAYKELLASLDIQLLLQLYNMRFSELPVIDVFDLLSISFSKMGLLKTFVSN